MLLLVIFAALALVLSAIGIHGVLSYAVAQRTREIGIRMALGASPRSVTRLVWGQGARLLSIGLAAGLVLAVVVARSLATLLFGVEPTDLADVRGGARGAADRRGDRDLAAGIRRVAPDTIRYLANPGRVNSVKAPGFTTEASSTACRARRTAGMWTTPERPRRKARHTRSRHRSERAHSRDSRGRAVPSCFHQAGCSRDCDPGDAR